MTGALNGVGLGLAASFLLSLGFRARSLGIATAPMPLFAAIAALPVAVSVCLHPIDELGIALVLVGSMVVVVGCVQGTRGVARARAQSNDAEAVQRLRALNIGFNAVAIEQAILALAVLVGDLAPLAVAAASFLVFAFVVCLGMLRLARCHEQRERRGLAWFARSVALLAGSALLLPLLAWGNSGFAGLALIAALLLPFIVPFATRVLVGAGPTPYELAVLLEPTRSRVGGQRAALATVCCFALGLQVLGFGRHHPRCAGLLVEAQPEANWSALPVIATGNGRTLGPFNFRAGHFNWKNYPSPYYDAALSDPKLCFGSTISLDRWFNGDMYRSPTELRLRQIPASEVFVVSVLASEHEETLVAAFQRRPGWRSEFDSELSRHYTLTGICLLGAGIASGVLWAWRTRSVRERDSIAQKAQVASFAFLIASAISFLMHEGEWSSDITPRPGREVAEEHGMI